MIAFFTEPTQPMFTNDRFISPYMTIWAVCSFPTRTLHVELTDGGLRFWKQEKQLFEKAVNPKRWFSLSSPENGVGFTPVWRSKATSMSNLFCSTGAMISWNIFQFLLKSSPVNKVQKVRSANLFWRWSQPSVSDVFNIAQRFPFPVIRYSKMPSLCLTVQKTFFLEKSKQWISLQSSSNPGFLGTSIPGSDDWRGWYLHCICSEMILQFICPRLLCAWKELFDEEQWVNKIDKKVFP